MRLRNVICIVFSLALASLAYYWGYLCGAQELDQFHYDSSLMSLSNNILIFDAIQIKDFDSVKPVIVSAIESDFAAMVTLHKKYEFNNTEHLRCAVSRRFRLLKEEGEVLSDVNSREEYPITLVNKYVVNECPGAPSHNNWLVNSDKDNREESGRQPIDGK
jgi:hypothetical protein